MRIAIIILVVVVLLGGLAALLLASSRAATISGGIAVMAAAISGLLWTGVVIRTANENATYRESIAQRREEEERIKAEAQDQK